MVQVKNKNFIDTVQKCPVKTQKLKLEKIHGALIITFYVSPSTPPLKRFFFFY